ncbi:hypothetical protein INS49_009717 [Diaporthe citri]|uniref:uncharacterized protein n=1 Tax=Diaporthe citri TaxID=83186 RepID=UPI001C81372A|nr:uncharacterized protein INS49_009717 [Diaporthe citri]KAG6361490.1 hypothetical protein INS49_009717 [Diaporthe citri]
MAPRDSTAELRRLRARQLLRFHCLSGSPYITKIQNDELEYARLLQPTFDENDPIPQGETCWPQNWSTKRKSLPAFLARWRALLPLGSPPASDPQATSPVSRTPLPGDSSHASTGTQSPRTLEHRRTVSLPSLPSSSRVSLGNTPPTSTYNRDLGSPSRPKRNDRTESEGPESDDDDMAPLTAEDAANLITQAMAQLRNQQNQDFAHLIATAFANAPVPQVHVQAGPAQNGVDGRSGIRPADVGYFCPRKHAGSGVWSDGKITKYFDVFHFIERLKHIERVHSADDVRRVWSQCLLEDALEWHSHVLTDNDRQLLETATVQAICDKLKSRFAKSFSDAMAGLKTDHLSLYQVAEGRDITSFLQTVIANAKACNMELPAQLIAAFESLAPEIKSELRKPNEATTLESFLDDVRNRESVILDLARQRYPSARNVVRPRQPTPAYGGRSNVPYAPRYPPSQPQRWQPQQRFQAQLPQALPQYNRPYTANQTQNQFQLPVRSAGRGQIWNAGYSRPWLPPDQYAAWRRQQDEQRQPAQQQPQPGDRRQQLVPENRRLPAPQAPSAVGPYQRNQPHQAYHGESADFVEQPDTPAYQPPSVEEVPDEEFSMDAAAEAFDYPFEEAFPVDDHDDYPDVAFFGTSASSPSVCRYCTKHFHSNNSLMDHVYSVHFKKPRPRRRQTSTAFAAEAETASPPDDQGLDGASKDAPEQPAKN